MASQNLKSKKPNFNIKINLDDGNIFVASVDIASKYYPPNNDNIGLIINVAKKYGKSVTQIQNKCIIMYLILSENSQINILYEICKTIFPLITKTINNKKDVVIHCNEGHCRSPTIAYLYLILTQNWSSSKAKAYFKTSKFMPVIHSKKSQILLDKLNTSDNKSLANNLQKLSE